MVREEYKNQVELLLRAIPEIAKEECFALHGGTAINLFLRNMPRLSVDIDLTYLVLEDYKTSQQHINDALKRIKANLQIVLPKASIKHEEKTSKLYISQGKAQIKVEVNLTGRGSLHAPVKMDICERAQEEFDVLVTMNLLPPGQIYGGKICAALDRQHPRDLFDVRGLLDNEGFSKEIKEGFLFYLLGHARPINEVLNPNWQDHTQAIETQFIGMTTEEYTYEQYEMTRLELLKTIQENLTKEDKNFILSFKELKPDWTAYNFEKFPNIAWKLENLGKLKEMNPEKHSLLYSKLKSHLFGDTNP